MVRQAVDLRLSQPEGARRSGTGVRQFERPVRAWKQEGAAGPVSRQRGRASHNWLAKARRGRIRGPRKEKYKDFGLTLAADKVLE